MRVPYYLRVFVAAALALGAGWWAATPEAAWWFGYDGLDGRFVPKFKLHWCDQGVVAGVVGLAAAVPAAVAAYLFDRLRGRRR